MLMNTEPKPFSVADFRARVARSRPLDDDAHYGDHWLNPGSRDAIVREGLREAAVLIPVIDDAQANVILTQRTEALRSHSGQVAFPGGRIDPEDGSAEIAALREAEEEIGLSREFVDVVGRLPDYFTGSGYRITPVLGIVRPGFELTINPDEVDRAFEVPLEFLMTTDNHRRESRVWQDIERHFYTMPYGDNYIWGVTAGIIREMHDRLYR